MFNLKKIAESLFITLICTTTIGGALSACSSKDEPTDYSDNPDVIQLEFNICSKVEDSSRSTTTTVYTTDEGTEAENYINLNNIHLLLYSPANGAALGGASWECELSPYIKEAVAGSNNQYRIVCQLPKEKLINSDNTIKPFVLAVTANWPKTPCYGNYYMMFLGLMNADDFEYNYGYNSTTGETTYFEPSKANPIPMYGVKQVDNYTSYPAIRNIYNIGTIYMDRAMAKIIVNDVKGGKISDVKLTKCVNRGMCAPWGMYKEVDEVTQDYVTIPRDVTSSYVTGTSTTFAGVTSTYENTLGYIDDLPFKQNGNSFVVYVPEYRNVSTANPAWGDSPTASQFEDPGIKSFTSYTTAITFMANNKQYTIEFKDCDYNGKQVGDLFNIIRNHVYKFDVEFGEDLQLFYVVEDWTEYVSGDIEYE